MSVRAAVAALTLAVLGAGCGGSHHGTSRSDTTSVATVAVRSPAATSPIATTPAHVAAAGRVPAAAPAQALVTDETQNRLLVVDLPSGHVVRWLRTALDPEDVAAGSGACSTVVVVSAAAVKVTVLDRETLNPRGVIGGFDAPHIPEIAPGG